MNHEIYLQHTPLCPPRARTPGEEIYLALWQEWTEAKPKEWEEIFCLTRPVDQRAASVAASFMTFMGSNAGQSFTMQALSSAGKNTHREPAFLAAWVATNQRRTGINCGLRAIEIMLAEEHPIRSYGLVGRAADPTLVPDVTMSDIDVVESMVCWWAGKEAQAMREQAEPMIAAARRKLLTESARG